MIAEGYESSNDQSQPPMTEKRSVSLIDTLERLNLFRGVCGISGTRDKVRIELDECADLEAALRRWDERAEDLAAVVGRFGFTIVTTTTVHLIRGG